MAVADEQITRDENRMLRAALRDLGNRVADQAIRDEVGRVLALADLRRRRKPRPAPVVEPKEPRYYRYRKPPFWDRNPLHRLLCDEVSRTESYDFEVAQ